MDRYVPWQDGGTERERSRLYELRSALSHGGKLLEEDRLTSFGGFHPRPIEEDNSARRAARLARLAGVNWVLAAGD
jgi:hypothetical protein